MISNDSAERPAPADSTAVHSRIPNQRAGSPPTGEVPPARDRVLASVWLLAPPAVAFALGNLLFAVAARRVGDDYLDPATHQRFDAGHYEQIARGGYEIFSCGNVPELSAAYGADSLCGNAGWFPFYPWVVRLLQAVTGWQWPTAAVIVAELATLAMFLLAWWLLVRVLPTPAVSGEGRRGRLAVGSRQLVVLTLALVVPAGVYFYAGFPMSLAVAASLAYLGLLARRRWLLAGLAGAVAAMSYPVAVAVAAPGLLTLAVMAWRREVRGTRTLGTAAACLVGLPAAGLLAVFAYLHVATGHWDAYFKIQSHYVGQGNNPLRNFFHLVVSPSVPGSAGTDGRGDVMRFASIAELWLALGLIVLVLLAAHIAALRGRLAAVDVGLAALAPLMFLAPLVVGTQISQYRSHLLMLPALLVLRHLPSWLLWPMTPFLAGLAYWMGTLFFPSILL